VIGKVGTANDKKGDKLFFNIISISDPDSTRSEDPDPDPGGQKLPTK
jgi:hypothetical protein